MLQLDIDTAIPLGLILNELITNSYKYAFSNRQSGVVRIELQKLTGGKYFLQYYDDGVGIPADLDFEKTDTLGLKLIRQRSRQLGGEMVYQYNLESSFHLYFFDFETRNKSKTT